MAVPDIGEKLAKKMMQNLFYRKELFSETYERKNIHFICMDCLDPRELAWHEAGKLSVQVTVHRGKFLW